MDFDPFKIHFTPQPIRGGGGAWRMARKFVKWIYPMPKLDSLCTVYNACNSNMGIGVFYKNYSKLKKKFKNFPGIPDFSNFLQQ